MKTKQTIRAAAAGLALVLIAGTPAVLNAAEAITEPAAEAKQDAKAIEILEKSIEAGGGAEAFKSVGYSMQSGSMSVPAMGITGTMKTYQKSPDKFLLVLNFEGIGEQRQGLNEGVAWSSDAMSGPRVLPEEEAVTVKREADVAARLDFKSDYPTIEYVGETTFDGKAAHEIRTLDTEGNEATEYYSTESYHLLGSVRSVPSPMGAIDTTTYLRDYKKYGELTQPTTIVQKIGPTQIEIKINSVSYDKFDEEIFELPAAIKTIVESSKEEG